MTDEQAMVRLDDVQRSYRTPGGGRLVAVDVDALVVPPGGALAVVGPNGSGKTTLLHLVAGLLRPDRGTIHVSGHELGGWREHELDRFRARHIGYLLQGAPLIDGLSAWENVAAAMLFAGQRGRKARERAQGLLDRVGLGERAGHAPHALSGGERQRVALARALACDPPLILADEPLASLDEASTRSVADELERLRREEGKTVIVATHRVAELGSGWETLSLPPARVEGGEP